MFATFWVLHVGILCIGGVIGAAVGAENPALLIVGLPIGLGLLDIVFFSPAIVAFLWLTRGNVRRAVIGIGLLYGSLALIAAVRFDDRVVDVLTDPIWMSFALAALLTSVVLQRRPAVP